MKKLHSLFSLASVPVGEERESSDQRFYYQLHAIFRSSRQVVFFRLTPIMRSKIKNGFQRALCTANFVSNRRSIPVMHFVNQERGCVKMDYLDHLMQHCASLFLSTSCRQSWGRLLAPGDDRGHGATADHGAIANHDRAACRGRLCRPCVRPTPELIPACALPSNSLLPMAYPRPCLRL
jgi:hypothetical protein